MNPLDFPDWSIKFEDYIAEFDPVFLSELTSDIEKYNTTKEITESQVRFLRLAIKSKIPNKKINTILNTYYTDKYKDNITNDTLSKDVNKSTSDNPVNSLNLLQTRIITEWNQLNSEDINVLFLALWPVTNITNIHVEHISHQFTLQECNDILKTNYTNYHELTYTQFHILKSDNKKFNLFSSDFPIVTNVNYELGIQYSKLCPDFKMFYLKFYDLMMLDLDERKIGDFTGLSNTDKSVSFLNLEAIEIICNKYKDEFTFHIYKSYNGYHIFITSEHINYDSERMTYISKLFTNDIFYLKFASKNGYKIRLSPKYHRKEEFISKFICTIGNKESAPDLIKLLKLHDDCIAYFEKVYQLNNINSNNLDYSLRLNSYLPVPDDMNDETKYLLAKNINTSSIYQNIITDIKTNDVISSYRTTFSFYKYFLSLNYNLWSFLEKFSHLKPIFNNLNNNKIRKYLLGNSDNIDEQHRNILLDKNYKNNSEFIRLLYISLTQFLTKPQRLIVDTDQYYVACDTYTKTYYICYANLLMCDVDNYKDNSSDSPLTNEELLSFDKSESGRFAGDPNANKLAFFTDYSITNNLTFRIYKSRNGFHLFLTSQKSDFKSEISYKIMSDLKTDFYYILYTKIRGWCVRLNRKDKETNESLYTYIGSVGNTPELPELVSLTNLHITLSDKFIKTDPSLIYSA